MTGNGGALAGLAVLDASRHFAGRYAARLFADHGADVELIEGSAEESPFGRHAYRPGEEPSGESAVFRHLNAGKFVTDRSRLDEGKPADRQALVAAAGLVDVVIVSDPALADAIADSALSDSAPSDSALSDSALSDSALSEEGGNRPLVGLVTDFGRHGPYVQWRGSELVHQALSGSMFINGLVGQPPLYGYGMRTSYAAGSYLYLSVVAGLIARMRGGEAPPALVEVTVHESAAAMEQNFSGQWNYNRTLTFRDEMARPKGRVECADGWVLYFLRPEQWPAYCRLLGRADLIDDPRFAEWSSLSVRWREAEAELRDSGRHLQVADMVAGAAELGLILAPLCEPESQFDDPQLAARDYWKWVEWPEAGRQRALGPRYRMSRTPMLDPSAVVARDVPALAQTPWVHAANGLGPLGPLDSSTKPLHGLRVLDLTVAWAGPMAGRHLAMLGADVIKIEGPTRVDSWRGEIESPSRTHLYPHGVVGDRPFDRSCWFNSQNHDKSTIVVDTKTTDGLALVRRLGDQADIVLVNYTPGALDRMGLGYRELSTTNPEVIVVEMPAFGTGGPQSSLKGLGPTMEAMAGLASLIGYPDSGPLGSGSAYLDPVGGLHGAAACLTALATKIKFGRGQHVEVAQREAAMHWAGEIFLAADRGAPAPVAAGNDRADQAPHGAYPTRGIDEWIAIDAPDDSAFAALCGVLDAPHIAADPAYSSDASRWTHRRALDADLSVETAKLDRHELASRLQAAGVPAAPVQHGGDLVADPHLNANGWFTPLDHPSVGRYSYPGLPYVFDGVRLTHRRASPTYGQHNHDIIVGTLGVDEPEYRRLVAQGIVTDLPRSE